MCSHTAEAQVLLDASASSPGYARRWAQSTGCVPHAQSIQDDALLLISELVTNAVMHGGSPIVLGIECEETGMRVRVRDGSPSAPVVRHPAPTDEGGRGMSLLDLLTDTWGVGPIADEHGVGKQVWFLLGR